MRKRKQGEQGPEGTAGGGEAKRITPVDIQQKEFGLAIRGYSERDVDQFLDEVTEEVARLYAENKRLREEVEFARTSRLDVVGAGEAEALLRRAREEAGRLLAEARARASALVPATATPGRATAAALAPFVAKEREFLQSLANLIQTHAEAVKDQIRRARDVAAQAASREAAQGGREAESREARLRESRARETAREEAARAALQEEAAARAALEEEAAARAALEEEARATLREAAGEPQPQGPPTEPWTPDELPKQGLEAWKAYYARPESEEGAGSGEVGGDEILDLTRDPGDTSGHAGEDDDERERRQLQPQRATREAEAPDDDSLEDRSIRELFWGEDY
jgi:DivIVA domain-containing protein